jgi:hypothetical protein
MGTFFRWFAALHCAVRAFDFDLGWVYATCKRHLDVESQGQGQGGAMDRCF